MPSIASDHRKSEEIVEISEQSEPLVPIIVASTSASLSNTRKKYSINEECIDKIEGAALVEAPSSSSMPSPSHTHEPLAGVIPMNRKRLGSSADGQRLTMSGTVTRGNGVGQSVEVQIELTENEFMRLTSRGNELKKSHRRKCSKREGIHIILLGIVSIPVALVMSLCMSFYNGATTWYNLIIYFSEERSVLYKLTVSPLIILSFPLSVGVSALCIAVVASVMQISWSWLKWLAEMNDGEKGFYGWFCSKIGLPKCSPYEVVILDETHS